MFREADTVDDGSTLTADVCIVGAGVAGLALAMRLEERGVAVLLLESGGKRVETEPQRLNAGESDLPDYPFEASRARAFGGTSRLWTGACLPLEPMDFEPRPWLPLSGWPLDRSDLDPYYAAARPLFGIPDHRDYLARLHASPFHGGDLEALPVVYSAPLDLGARYAFRIERSAHVTCLLKATVTELVPDPLGTRVERVEARSASGRSLCVSARHVVLACGGIENARLLLASNRVVPTGLGNATDMVGRCQMEHPIRAMAVLPIGDRASALLAFTNRDIVDGSGVQGTLGLSAACRAGEEVLNMHLRAFRFSTLENLPAIIAGKAAARRLRRGRGLPEEPDAAPVLRDLGRAIRPATLRYLSWHLQNKLRRAAPFDHLRFTAFLEHEPDPDNRITLAGSRDRFGRPLPRIAYRETAFASDSIRRSEARLRHAFAARGFGRLISVQDEMPHLAAYDQYGLHHMGATRMASDPRFGVVDRDCRVHGMANLHVAGSSVFATGGAANPTWTIAALALRLGDSIVGRLTNR